MPGSDYPTVNTESCTVLFVAGNQWLLLIFKAAGLFVRFSRHIVNSGWIVQWKEVGYAWH